MPLDAEGQKALKRIPYVLVSCYAGQVVGDWIANGYRLDARFFGPLRMVGIFAGSILTP